MERLTERMNNVPDGETDVWVKNHDYIAAAEKLADYEDAEEDELLIKFPCKIGDILYYVCDGRIIENTILETIVFEDRNKLKIKLKIINEKGYEMYHLADSIGKTSFLTREEVEEKLKEMEEDE